jgi:hypothetical protein
MAPLNPDQKRDRQLNVALRADELATLQARADAAGLRLVVYARTVLLGEPVKREIVILPSSLDRLAYQQWVRAGSNLNQIARRLNALGNVAAPEVEAALREVRALIAKAHA